MEEKDTIIGRFVSGLFMVSLVALGATGHAALFRAPENPPAQITDRDSDADPPFRFQGNRQVYVSFVSDTDIPKQCGNNASACGNETGITITNPCTYRSERGIPFFRGDYLNDEAIKAMDVSVSGGDHLGYYTIDSETYARTLCHELGHANGWSGYHPDENIGAVAVDTTEQRLAEARAAIKERLAAQTEAKRK